MDNDKRVGKAPISDNLDEILNAAQRQALSGLEYTGWKPRFLRRPLFQEPELVMQNTTLGKTGILNKDGSIEILPGRMVREQDIRATIPPPNDPLVWTK